MGALPETTSRYTGADLMDCSRYGELEDVEVILASGVDVNHKDTHGNTALHLSCANGHAEVIRALVKAGAEHVPNAAGNRPLQWAVQSKHSTCVKALLELYPEPSRMNVLDKNGFGKSALTDAFKSGDAEMVKMVLHHQSAEEDMLLSQSSLGKGKGGKEEEGSTDDPGGNGGVVTTDESRSGSGLKLGRTEKVSSEGCSVSVTHELGFGVGASNEEDEEAGFRVRELPIRNPDECFGEDAKEDTTGLSLWGAAVVLARWMAEPTMQARLEGKTVLELGAGCGAGGISAAVHGRPASVVITDLNVETMANLGHNVEINRDQYPAGVEVRAVTLDWGDESTWEAAAPPVDVVLAADIVYQATATSPLLHAIRSLLKPGGSFFHVSPVGERDGLEGFLKTLGIVEGGDDIHGSDSMFELISGTDAPAEYRQNPLIAGSEEAYILHFNELPRTTFRLHEFRKRA